MKRALILVAIAGGLTGAAAAQVRVQQPPGPAEIADRRNELQKILDQYAAGDREIVARSLSTPDLLTRAAMRELLDNKDAPWHPARAVFALEIADTWSDGVWSFDMGALGYGRGILERRPTPIGGNTIEDRIELLYHQVALGMLEGRGSWPAHHAYLTLAGSRLDKLEAKYPKVSNRVPLMRALDVAMVCCREKLAGNFFPGTATVSRSDSRPAPSPTPSPEYATFLFEQAAHSPALQQEALVRAAYIQHRYGHAAKALALLDRTKSPGDPILDYAAAMIRGGLLDRDRPERAAEAYAEAARVAPGAQVPAIGVAAALQRAGRVEDATRAAEHARRLPVDGFDPWPDFLRADARFVRSWISQLRELLK